MVFLTNLAVLNSSLGHYDQAVQAYLDMRPLSPEKDRVDAMIVETYRSREKSGEGQSIPAEVALKETPNSRQLQIISADMIAEKGKVDEGIKALESLSKGGQPDLELLFGNVRHLPASKEMGRSSGRSRTRNPELPDGIGSVFSAGSHV